MPGVDPMGNQGTVAPGVVTNQNQYPQWGVDQKYDIAEAKSSADKQADLGKGYLIWFSSAAAAKSWISNQKNSFLSGQVPNPLSGIAGGIAAFYHAVTDGKLWRSLGWVLLGILLMLAGVALWIGPSAARSSPVGALAEGLG